MRQLDFFIVGVQKGGTTALDRMLRAHPSIQMSAKKEIHFFDNEQIDWSAPEYGPLHDQFDWSREALRGEATPIYIYWPHSMERLARYNPSARLIVCLRHPVYRAHSHWRMETKRGRDNLAFADAIRAGRARVGEAHRTYSYVERGFYASQLRRAFGLFDRRCMLFLRTDDLWSRTGHQLERVYRFLGVPPIEAASREYVVLVDTAGMEAMTDSDRDYLWRLYADDIAETAELTGLDLTDWLNPEYRERIGPT